MAMFNDLRKVWKNLLSPTPAEIKIGKKELRVIRDDTPTPENKDSMFTKELSMKKCAWVAKQCPLFMKGARKKAADSIRAWHFIESLDKKKSPPIVDLNIINDFTRRNQLPKLWFEARVASFIYGDSYLLITFEGDENTELHDPPAEGAIPWKVRIMNSEHITDIDYFPQNKEYYKKRFIQHFHYVDNANTGWKGDYWIHPDRLIHMVGDKLPNKKFGASKVNLLRNIIRSIINVDIACGDILAWFAHAVMDIQEDGLEEPERKMWEKIANQHPGAWIHNERSTLKSIQPQAIDPEHFYNYLILKVAATFQMPTHILTGIQVGKVTGAEIGTGDYVKDCKDDQDLEFTPLLEDLYARLLKSKERTWKYTIVWNPIYIDELAEAEIMLKKVQAIDLALNGAKGAGGYINEKEARAMYNRGQIVLEENVPSDIKKPSIVSTGNPGNDDEDDEEENRENLYNYQLTESDKLMIKKRKQQAKKERELGNKILEEQDNDGSNKSESDGTE